MAAAYAVEYRPEVEEEDLRPLPHNLQSRILRAIESRLMIEPARYGQRLRRSLLGLWKLRVGDYRIVYEVQGKKVRVWAICHRKEAYDIAEGRWPSSAS